MILSPHMSKTASIFYQSSTAEMATGSGVYTPGNLARMSIAYQAGASCVDSDGSAAGCASPASIPTVTQLGIGMNRNQFGSVLNGTVPPRDVFSDLPAQLQLTGLRPMILPRSRLTHSPI